MTYIDYGNSENVLEGEIVGDVGEIPDTDCIDQFVKIKDPMETLIINNRPLTLKRGQHAVTILCIWFNENQNLVEDILGAAMASITNAHVQENPPCKI